MATAHSHFEQPGAATIEPLLVSIPGGWFLMGSDSGQDCERPVHRVWIDAFLLPPLKSPTPNTTLRALDSP